MQGEVLNRPLEDGRKPDEKDIRLWNLVSMAGGVSGILYPALAPAARRPLFGAFGIFNMDGTPNPRSETAGRIARWAQANPQVWKSRPVKGDVGIAFVPESERFNFAQQGNTSFYAESARGAYMAFFDSNLQPDWVHIDHIGEHPVVYLPYPVMLSEATARKLRKYVEDGGTLINEGLPAYFGDRGRAGTRQPNYGLDEVFGAREADVEFTPDLLDKLPMRVKDRTIAGRFFRQVYQPTTGKPAGSYTGGAVAAVENSFGKGRTLLIGSFPAAAYFRNPLYSTRDLFRSFVPRPQVTVSDPGVTARLHTGEGGVFLWILNPAREAKDVAITLPKGPWQRAGRVWGDSDPQVTGSTIRVRVGDRDGAVLRLE